MNDKVNELVEWIADILNPHLKYIQAYGGSSKELANQILSHPDLALIDREAHAPESIGFKPAGMEVVIPLADTIKEIK